MSDEGPSTPDGQARNERNAGWYPAENSRADRATFAMVQYWDGARWTGIAVRANRWGTAPRDLLGWVGIWLVVIGTALVGLLTVITVGQVTSTDDGGPGLADNGTSFPLAWFVASGVIIGAGTLCGLAASIRAESRNYTSAQARIALKAGGGLLLATIVFGLTGLAVLALGIVIGVIIFILGVIVLGLILAHT